MKVTYHQYGLRAKSFRSVSVVGVVVFLLGIFFLLIGFLASLTDDFSTFLNAFAYFALFSLFIPFICIFIYHLYSDLGVDEKGLYVRFLRKSLDVAWNEIDDMKSLEPKLLNSMLLNVGIIKKPGLGPLSFKLSSSTTRQTTIERRFLVVTNSQLTIFHRLYGIVFGRTIKPSFLVTSSISEFPDLMNKLSLHINKP